MAEPVHVIGGGLAGSEAAWQIARSGVACVLHEGELVFHHAVGNRATMCQAFP